MLSEKQKRPKVKEFAKFLVLSEGKLFFICESAEDLVRWCYADILSLLFQYTFRKAIAPKNHAVNHIHILALSLMLSEIFIFESADSV